MCIAKVDWRSLCVQEQAAFFCKLYRATHEHDAGPNVSLIARLYITQRLAEMPACADFDQTNTECTEWYDFLAADAYYKCVPDAASKAKRAAEQRINTPRVLTALRAVSSAQ